MFRKMLGHVLEFRVWELVGVRVEGLEEEDESAKL
jgi:hypothetical protein